MRVLTISLLGWVSGARLPRTLSHAGFNPAILCVENEIAAHTRFVERRYLVKKASSASSEPDPDALLAELLRANREWNPTLLIPTDELAARFLHSLAGGMRWRRSEVRQLAPLLEKSLGNPSFYRAVESKHRTTRLASRIGIPVPETLVTNSARSATEFAETVGFPVVVKLDCGAAGRDVVVCADQAAIERAYRNFLPEGWKRRLYWQLYKQFPWRRWELSNYRDRLPMHVQKYIPGPSAMCSIVALRGKVLAAACLLKEQTYPGPTGPSSVIRVIENRQMVKSATRLAQHIGYSGFGSVDFILEEGSGRPVFLEFNYRTVPAHYLGPKIGVRFCRALKEALEGRDVSHLARPEVDKLIAMFPNEDLRDPRSPYFKTADHDVPTDDPELLQALLERCADIVAQRTPQEQTAATFVGEAKSPVAAT